MRLFRPFTSKLLGLLLPALLLPLLTLTLRQPGADEPLPRPTAPVVLTVTGDIARTNAPGRAEFDLPMLQALGVETLSTSTAWTDGTPTFEGVSARKVMQAVGARGSRVVARALNDFTTQIEIADFERYPVLLAWRMDDQMLTLRDRGPLWIVWPSDDFPELDDPKLAEHWVWQLQSLDVQ